jgi:hypothetical protein
MLFSHRRVLQAFGPNFDVFAMCTAPHGGGGWAEQRALSFLVCITVLASLLVIMLWEQVVLLKVKMRQMNPHTECGICVTSLADVWRVFAGRV